MKPGETAFTDVGVLPGFGDAIPGGGGLWIEAADGSGEQHFTTTGTPDATVDIDGVLAASDEDAIAPLWKGSRFPAGACISGWAMMHRRTVVIEDVFSDDRIPHHLYAPTFVKSLAMVPVRETDPIGAIGAYWATNHGASTGEVEILRSIAEASSLALENVRLYENLQQALDRAEALNRAKDEWMSVLSHELRTPLTPILGWTKMLRSDRLDTRRRDYALEVIERNVDDEIRIVEDLLDVSRMMLGRLRIEPQPVDVRAAIRSAVKRYEREAEGKGVALLVSLPPEPVQVTGDNERLTRAVANLVANACANDRTGHGSAEGPSFVGDALRDLDRCVLDRDAEFLDAGIRGRRDPSVVRRIDGGDDFIKIGPHNGVGGVSRSDQSDAEPTDCDDEQTGRNELPREHSLSPNS